MRSSSGHSVADATPLRHRSSRKFAALLAYHGLVDRVVELPESTRTAADAARAVGCDVRQIVKSLVFRTQGSGHPVLVLASGAHRVDEEWLTRYVGEPLLRADPEFVRSVSGFAIGGVPPVGHPNPLRAFIDYDLLELREVWGAAGHPNAIFRLSSSELLRITQGRPVPVVPLTPELDLSGPWISFDCYGTLVDWRRGFSALMKRVLGPIAERELVGLFRAYLVEEQDLEAGPYRSYREIMIEAVEKAAVRMGRSLPRDEAAQLPESVPDWPLFPDTQAALSRLQALGFRTAILSNIDRDLLERTVASHALPVDLTVTAEEVGSYKPAPAHWIRFLKATGTSPDESLHVAGGYEYDLPSASMLGFRTAYVPRYGEPGGPAAQAVVADLAELARRMEGPHDALRSG